MHKPSSLARGSRGASKTGRKRGRTPLSRNKKGWWYGFVTRVAQEDLEKRGEPPDLTEEQVLEWADAFLARTGDWPSPHSGPILEAPGETWLLVAAALTLGIRGFPPHGSIPRLLDEHRGRYNLADPKFTTEHVLAWADAWYERTGDWPYANSGVIPGAGGVKWNIVDAAFRHGRGVIPGESSLAHFLASKRGVIRVPPLTEEQVLAWADAFHRRHGSWPEKNSGPIAEAPGENWNGIDSALYKGYRGLPGGSTLARLFAQERGKRYAKDSRTITVQEILEWADAFRQLHGTWPDRNSGPIPEAPGENWQIIHNSLRAGRRGLPAQSSIARLLAEHRGRRNSQELSRFTIQQILAWADRFHERTGRWPSAASGVILETQGDTWAVVHAALQLGRRGLAGGSSLARLLAEHRGRRNQKGLPRFTIPQILAWADAFHARTGRWPTSESGVIPESQADTWNAVHSALQMGSRGLPGGSTIARLLADERGRRNIHGLPDLSIEQILTWSDAFHARTGRWPRRASGPVAESSTETWQSIDRALTHGTRGLAGNSSIARLLAERRGCRIAIHAPDLTVEQILAWADAFHARTGRWPTNESGAIPESPGEAWHTIRYALKKGNRGLPSGVTLYGLLQQERGHKSPS
jgi:hypothetical protein